MSRKKTHEEFIDRVRDRMGNEYDFLERYNGSNVKIKALHKVCGHEYMVKPIEFQRGSRCPKCFGKKKKTTKEFKEQVSKLVGDGYSVLGEYVGNKDKILMMHNVCGYKYEVTPTNFLDNKRRCPNCFGAKKKTTKIFKKEVYNLVKNDYIVLGEYINNNTFIKMKHVNCGKEYDVKPTDFLSGRRCPHCFRIDKKTQKQFETEVKEIYGDEYEVIGKYINANHKIEVKHTTCGKIFKVRPIALLRGSTCVYCSTNISKGAKKVRAYLNENNIDYYPEYIFKDLKFKKYLRFDFAILKKDKVLGLIEYHGVQHYEETPFMKESLEDRQMRDKLKVEYCKDKKIPLLTIPYTELKTYKSKINDFINHINKKNCF